MRNISTLSFGIMIMLIALFLGAPAAKAQQNASIKGKVIDDLDEAVLMPNIVLKKANGEMVGGVQGDYDGNYFITNISGGTYDIEASALNYPTLTIKNIKVSGGGTLTVDFKLNSNTIEPVIVEYERPIVDVTNPSHETVYDKERFAKDPNRGYKEVAGTTVGVSKKDIGEDINVNNSRKESNQVIIDDQVVLGNASNIPETEIAEMRVITAGIPAEYGDATGGLIIITTKDPSNKFSGGVQLESSQFLDAFGENRIDFGFSGPILRTPIRDNRGEILKDNDGLAKTRTLLGYRLSGTYQTSLDSRPSALGSFKLKDDVLQGIKESPLVANPEGDGRALAADYLRKEDFEYTAVRPNARESYGVINGKLEYKPNANVFISAGGQFQFDWGKNAGTLNRLFNSDYNPEYRTNSFRTFIRLRQNIASTTINADEVRDTTKLAPVLQNLSYQIQADYLVNNSYQADPRYGDRLFEYGYVGRIDRSLVPVIGAIDSVAIRNSEDSIIGYDVNLGHAANFVQFDGFTADPNINTGLAAYNNLIDQRNITTMEELEIVNGRFTGNRSSVYGLFNNVHANGSNYGKSQSSQLRGTIKINFNLVANRRSATPIRHAITLGGVYEQRVERSYSVNPFNLWTLADQSANEHLSFAADRSRPTGETFFDPTTQRYYERFENLIRTDEEGNPNQMSAFGERVRAEIGAGEREWVNVHALRPDQMNLGMFEPTTLIQGRQSVLDYFGYDYLGNPLGTSTQFNDFFSEVDADGRKTRPIAPVKPIYMAGYLQDQFMYGDIIVRAGLRIDAYDANTKVLRDPYTIAGAFNAKEFENSASGYSVGSSTEYNRPSNIGDDYMVYVNENSPDASVIGYRNGDKWYNAQGTPLNNARELGSNFIPALRGFSSAENDPQGENYNPDLAFRDYRPSLLVMPRLSFSFPIIKDQSAFYASYDVLGQRPPVATVATPLTYFNFRENAANSYIANPNLESQRVINYEIGYEQALSQSSRIKLSMLYREERNLIQLKQIFFAYPVQYTTFGNDDFSTAKSFMFEYELRPRKKGKELKASNSKFILNYSLQFAEGTGSSPTSSATIAATDLKYIFPLDFEQRHTFFANWDYRYKSGADYNGPRIGKFDILANTGMNLSLTAFSGSPYTRKLNPGGIGTSFQSGVTEGSINGARLPWSYRVDVRFDRDITIGGKTKGEGKAKSKAYNLNVYIRVQNLLNTQNILSVYPATGSPTDDGFLTLQNSQGLGLLGLYPESYSQLYDLRMQNPFNISRPRRIFLGAVMNF
jgi:hypothetical protein